MTRLLDIRGIIFIAVLVIALIAVPVLSLATPEASALHMPPYIVALVGKYLCLALLALALDLVWGYCGILSLGHGAFFALGGYAMGMYLMRQIGSRGSYANPLLPDFMVFLNWDRLPVTWWGFNSFSYTMLMVLAVPGVLAFVVGWLTFRSRVTGVYLSIITQAMTYALLLAFYRNEMGFGGNNGLTDFKDILGFSVQADATRAALFCLSGLALIGGYLVARAVTLSKFGKVLIAIRDAESRTRFLGYRVEDYKLVVFTLSAMMAGVAGALYVPQVGIINPSEFAPANSIEAVIWVAVGGRGTLVGAALGAVVVNYAKTVLTGGTLSELARQACNEFGRVVGVDAHRIAEFAAWMFGPENWLYVLGLIFVLVTLFLPQGLLGLTAKRQRRRQSAPPPDPESELVPATAAE